MTVVLDTLTITTRPKDPGHWYTAGRKQYRRRDERGDKTRVYFFPEGESVLEHLVARHARPYDAYRTMLPEVFWQAGLYHAGMMPSAKARWSQRAGCSCPCSPGFILDFVAGYDVYVTVSQSDDAHSVTFPQEEA